MRGLKSLGIAPINNLGQAQRWSASPPPAYLHNGFQIGHEMYWLPRAMQALRDELKDVHVTISSDYSPNLAEALARGRNRCGFPARRTEPRTVLRGGDGEPPLVPMPSDHCLTSRETIHPRELLGGIFIGGSHKATGLRALTEDYPRRGGLNIKLDHRVGYAAVVRRQPSAAR
jgi:LysR family transcriptional regulator, hca operon transcriptional activator